MVIAISCHEKDYRLCWRLNKACGLELERCEPDPLNPDVTTAYCFYEEDEHVSYLLIANRNDKGWLMPKHKHVDYFFTLSDPHHKPLGEILSSIRGVTNVLAAFELGLEDPKERGKLILS